MPDVDARDPIVEAYKRDVDRTLLRESLRRTPEERLLELRHLQAFAEEGPDIGSPPAAQAAAREARLGPC